jgi:hypothetical protein
MKKLLLIFISSLLYSVPQAQVPLNIAEMNHETFSNDLNNNVNNLNSWEGFLSNPTGQKLSLNILVNVIYDQTPEMDPYYNNPGGAWPEETVSGINNSDPLPEWLPGLFDTEYNENGITHGIYNTPQI